VEVSSQVFGSAPDQDITDYSKNSLPYSVTDSYSTPSCIQKCLAPNATWGESSLLRLTRYVTSKFYFGQMTFHSTLLLDLLARFLFPSLSLRSVNHELNHHLFRSSSQRRTSSFTPSSTFHDALPQTLPHLS
jgi:hypothetical protein